MPKIYAYIIFNIDLNNSNYLQRILVYILPSDYDYTDMSRVRTEKVKKCFFRLSFYHVHSLYMIEKHKCFNFQEWERRILWTLIFY